MTFTEELIIDGGNFVSKEEVITSLAERLVVKGYVRPEFLEAVLEREKKFPTGLPTKPVGVAIPHADPHYCLQPCLSVARLAKPVKFRLMGDEEQEVDVSLVLLFGLDTSSKHLSFLSGLAEILQDEEILAKIMQAGSISELRAVIGTTIGIL